MKSHLVPAPLIATVCVALLAVSTPAEAASAAQTFKNCTAIRAVCSGGIAKEGVTSNTTH